MPRLSSFISPLRWRDYAERRLETWRRDRGDDVLDAELHNIGPVRLGGGQATIVADGMWRNPNHFLRLRLFLEAFVGRGSYRLLGILRRRSDWRERRALERIGFREFVFIEEDEIKTEQFLAEAALLLAGARSHADLLKLTLPEELPAYVYFDTVLKLAAHPRPPLTSPLWQSTLAELLRNLAIYRRELAHRDVREVVLSHPWKSEWAALTWLSLGRDVPVYHLTGFCEGLRIRRFRRQEDYATPVEHLPVSVFNSLAADVQEEIASAGASDLDRRTSGCSSDLNVRYAFNPSTRIAERTAARLALSGQAERPVVVIYGHVWYDFPHTFAMRNFTDFLDWTECTLGKIRTLEDTVWLLKPHPTEGWYGGFSLADVAQDLPAHVRLLPRDTDSQTAIMAADSIVTVHGTIGLEAAAQGIPVVLGDRSYYSDWDVGYVAQDRAHYLSLLQRASRLAPPDHAAQKRARACFAMAVGEPPAGAGALKLSCDSSGSALYSEVSGLLRSNRSALARESERILRFLDQDAIDSFAAYHLLMTASLKRLQQVA